MEVGSGTGDVELKTVHGFLGGITGNRCSEKVTSPLESTVPVNRFQLLALFGSGVNSSAVKYTEVSLRSAGIGCCRGTTIGCLQG